MAITTTDIKVIYELTATTDEFSFNIPFFEIDDVNVTVNNIDLIEGLDFTVHPIGGDPSDGAIIKTDVDYHTGDIVLIYRDVEMTQEIIFKRGGNFNANAVNDGLDRGVAISQQIDDKIARSLTFPSSDPDGLDYDLPSVANRENKVVSFDEYGNVTVLGLLASGAVGVDESEGLQMDANIISTKVDDYTMEFDVSGKLSVKTIGADELRDDIVSTSTIQTDSVTYEKIQDVTANLKALGNVNGGGTVGEIPIENSLNTTSTSHDSLATALCIKDYIDIQVDDSETAGYTPTTYAGEQSVQLPNGLIMKWGSKNGNGAVTFTTPFPNSCVSAQVSVGPTSSGSGVESTIQSKSATALVLWNNAGYHNMMWTAIGF